MCRKLYHAVLGVIAGVFLSLWVIPFASAVYWLRCDPKDWGRGGVAIFCLVLGGVAGLVFGLRWGGYRLAKRQAIGAIVGAVAGVACGILIPVGSGMLTLVVFTVPMGLFLGILVGVMTGPIGPDTAEGKQDEDSISRS